jgi:hypothetical protein
MDIGGQPMAHRSIKDLSPMLYKKITQLPSKKNMLADQMPMSERSW